METKQQEFINFLIEVLTTAEERTNILTQNGYILKVHEICNRFKNKLKDIDNILGKGGIYKIQGLLKIIDLIKYNKDEGKTYISEEGKGVLEVKEHPENVYGMLKEIFLTKLYNLEESKNEIDAEKKKQIENCIRNALKIYFEVTEEELKILS